MNKDILSLTEYCMYFYVVFSNIIIVGFKLFEIYSFLPCGTMQLPVKVRYSLDATLQLLVSNLLALLSNLFTLVQSYSWYVLYHLRGTHERLLDDLWEWFLTQLRMLAFGIMSWITIMSTGQSSDQCYVAKSFVTGH